MFKFISLAALFIPVVLTAACGGTADVNTNGNANGGVKVITLDNANLPPGFSTSPVPITNAQTPGIPSNVNTIPKGTTPTPGIPSAEELKRGMKRGATPTPGIPSEAEMRRQMTVPAGNMNAAGTTDPRPVKGSRRP